MAKHLLLATLPHRDPGDIPVWRRVNGRFSLSVHPFINDDSKPLYPFGSIPRLLLIWLVTEAVQTKKRHMILGRSLADFMRQIGLNPDSGGGRRGDAQRLKDQMVRLFAAQLRIENSERSGDMLGWINIPVTATGVVYQSALNSATPMGSIVLGEAFYATVTTKAVPVDRRALNVLKGSPFDLDLYIWATYRVFTLRGGECFIPWRALQKQFGSSYTAVKDFKRAAKRSLCKVSAVFPGFRYRAIPGGLKILKSLPAVSPVSMWNERFVHGDVVPPDAGEMLSYDTVKRSPLPIKNHL
ncbi:MAG TPA: replication protein RepA [Dongiaceae bacterium]|nr:replication protein RepA [Dongiaceae bacterium]